MVYWRTSMVLTDTSTSLGLWWEFGVVRIGVFVVEIWCFVTGVL
jgi:hypothetical protein